MEVSPQEEMDNPQGIEMFVVEKNGPSQDFVSCRDLFGVKLSPLVLRRISRLCGARYNGRHQEILWASGLGSPELSAQIRRPDS